MAYINSGYWVPGYTADLDMPSYTLGIELVAGSFTNVTSRLERCSWDRTVVDMFTPPGIGHALFELANDDGQMSPRQNTNFTPGKRIKLNARFANNSYALFSGRITEVSMSPRLGARTAVVAALDDWDRVQRLTYTTQIFVDVPVQSLFCALMSLSEVSSFQADGTIVDRVGFKWYRDRSADHALNELVRSGNYTLTLDGNGTYALKDRYWAGFATAVASASAADDVRASLSRESVVNQAHFRALPRRLISAVTTLAFIPTPIYIPASSAIGFWMAFQDPNEPTADVPTASLETLTSSTDYYTCANSDGTGTDLTSALNVTFSSFAASAVASLYNASSSDAWLTRFQVRGYPYSRLPEISARYDVASSQTLFGTRNITVDDALIQDQTTLSGLARSIAVDRKDGRDRMQLTMTNEFTDVLGLEPGESIDVTETFGNYTDTWRVRGSSHELSLAGGLRHTARFDMEAYDTPFLVLDDATRGKLDDGRMLSI